VYSIGDYGFLSDCRTAALVSRDGSIDWHCPISFDAPSVFGRILDPDAGHWRIAPLEAGPGTRHYLGESLVLRTELQTPGGAVAITDFLAFAPGSRAAATVLGARTARWSARLQPPADPAGARGDAGLERGELGARA